MDTVAVYGPFVSRALARERNLRHFYDGTPCAHGHICARYARNNACMECNRMAAEKRRDRIIENIKTWRKNNPDKVAAYQQKLNDRYKNDVSYRERRRKTNKRARDKAATERTNYYISMRTRVKINKLFKRHLQHNHNSGALAALIGCTAAEYKTYIESMWLEGMNWQNWTCDGWHIDHIKPCDVFDLTDTQQLKACFHYTNTQPLWAEDNRAKWNIFNKL